MIEQIQPKLDRIKKADQNRPRKKIAVLGAGMAGLVAAYELASLGHEVVIYEANDRIGGRAWTHRFDDGQYHEFGAMRFPMEHDHTRYYAKKCGLSFRTFIKHHDEPNSFYFIKGVLTEKSSWGTKLLPELNLTEFEKWMIDNGPIPAEARHAQLLNLLVYPFKQLMHEISSNPHDLNAILGTGPITERIKEIDKISLGEYLKKYNTSTDAIELIGGVTGLEVWWDKAVSMFIREELAAEERLKDQGIEEGRDEIIGGTDQLPNGMLNMLSKLKVEIKTEHEVFSINKQSEQIQLGIKNKLKETLEDFDYVICTLPFSILRTISLAGFSKPKMTAIRNLNYASSAKVLLNTKNRFWEAAPYNIKGGASQTDLINRQIYYPSGNTVAVPETNASQLKGLHGQVQKYSKFELIDDSKESPGILVGSYVWGMDARRLGALEQDDRAVTVIDAVSKIHPEIMEVGMVKDTASISWDNYKYANGAFCFMKPGDFSNYYQDAISSEGNLFFAGEHCSLDNGWIQGAIISSLKAVETLVNK
ncbi:NAD(P)/FAD-dependent oxidoreductase [uncultured Roseivirga sp.]|uniref:flavin monoamine oxidase family protein n=1 Tax=uncultured Roseivirga sp. TaxID=543088 RepID=UPI0030DBBD25|tara:strand:+ start:282575 stop:284176 length:1602 start_codon:yes stop_codon:yes gene_type:complete